MKYVGSCFAVLVVCMLAAVTVFLWLPGLRSYLYVEDSLVEYLTAALYLFTFILGLGLLRVRNLRTKAFFFVAIGFVGFLDELSCGARFFGWEMPVVHGMRIDGLHDLFGLGYMVVEEQVRSNTSWLLLYLFGAIVITVILLVMYRQKLRRAIPKVPHEPTFVLLSVFAVLAASSLILDLGFWRHQVRYAAEELLEMGAAIALLFCCLSLYRRPSPSPSVQSDTVPRLRFPG
ncbi:MAG: hypothetical protein JSW50_02050 [Candidatus Latescibacterota bacterium]|nr:MAG: hypothetical protein JSW50_02050 [Candidatus Latescibacterota bacterium]